MTLVTCGQIRLEFSSTDGIVEIDFFKSIHRTFNSSYSYKKLNSNIYIKVMKAWLPIDENIKKVNILLLEFIDHGINYKVFFAWPEGTFRTIERARSHEDKNTYQLNLYESTSKFFVSTIFMAII